MTKKELITIEMHFSTPDNVICIGKSIHNDYFLLVITISNKQFTKKDIEGQNESYCIMYYNNKYYKIEVSLYPNLFSDKKRLFHIFMTLKNVYKNIYKLYKNNKYNIKTNSQTNFDYRLYNLPINIWLASIGYIVGIL
jgi:hypothetical protein